MGAKANLAPLIVRELGRHRSYWEPMSGSMAVLLCKKISAAETVNDLHGDLINLALVVRDPKLSRQLYSLLRKTWHVEAIFSESNTAIRHGIPRPPNVERAYHYFVWSWMGRCGVSGTAVGNGSYPLRYTAGGGSSGSRFVSAVDSIPAWHERMRSVVIVSRDVFEILDKIEDEPGTVIYLDPPYLKKTKNYVHDFSASDHERLAKSVTRFMHTRVVVSYYDDPRLAELYPNWRSRTIDVTKSLSHVRKRGESEIRAQEVLLVNGPLVDDNTLF